MNTIPPTAADIRPSALPPGDTSLSEQLAARDAREQFAKDNRQASLTIDLARDQTFVGAGAFGIKGTPAQAVDWILVAPNTATYQNVAATFGAAKPTTDDMTLKIYGELALPGSPIAGDQNDAFVLLKGTTGLTPKHHLELRSAVGLVGADLADHSIAGLGPQKAAGYFTPVFGAAVDFKTGKIDFVHETLGGQAGLPRAANRNRDSANVQIGPFMKTAGYAWVNSSGNGNQIPLAARAARNLTRQPLVGSAVQAAEVGKAVNDALVHPKTVNGIDGKPVSTSVEVMGRTVIGAPLGTTGLAAGLGLESRATLKFTPDGTDDVEIKYPSGDTVHTTFHDLQKRAAELLEPVNDVLANLGRKAENGAFGSPYDPAKLAAQQRTADRAATDRLQQQVHQIGGREVPLQRDAATGAWIVPPTAGQTQNAATTPAQLTVAGPDGKPVSFQQFHDAVAARQFSGSEAATRGAQKTLDAFAAQHHLPQQAYNGYYNTIWSDYLGGAIKSQIGGLSKAQTATPQDASVLSHLRDAADTLNNWQIHNGLPQLLPGSRSKELDAWVQWAQKAAAHH